MDPHRRAELRSLAYHREIAARLADEPMLLERARSRVAGWQGSGTLHPRWVAEWVRILALPHDELLAALVADTEPMVAARQSTPFAGALSARARWTLWRQLSP